MSRFGSTSFGGGGGFSGGGGGGGGSGRWNEYGSSGGDFGGGGGFEKSGGFFQGGSGDPNATSVEGAGGVKGTGKSPEVVPVTISEIVKCSDLKQDRMKIGNVEVNRITLVAQVRECKAFSSYTSFLLDDKTGSTIEAKMWGDTQEEQAKVAVGAGQYVRVYGSIKSMGDNVAISAYIVQPITDLNEVFFHMVDVIHSHAVLEKIAQGEMGGEAGAAPAQQEGFVAGVPAAAGPAAGGTDATPNGLTPDQRAVYAYLRGCGGEGDVREMHKVLKQFKKQDLERAVETLSGEGHIYSTTDDHHYRIVDTD